MRLCCLDVVHPLLYNKVIREETSKGCYSGTRMPPSRKRQRPSRTPGPEIILGYACPGCKKSFDRPSKLNMHKVKSLDSRCRAQGIERSVWQTRTGPHTLGGLRTERLAHAASAWEEVQSRGK